MRKTVLAGLIAGIVGGAVQAAPLTFSLTGNGANVIVADALDWAPTSFLALGGNLAITNKVTNDFCALNPVACPGFTPLSTTFDVLTHAKLTGYTPPGGSQIGLPAGFAGEITITARFTETVSSASTALGFATFATTGAGWVEMYYSAAPNSAALTGSDFNDGTLIMRSEGVTTRGGGASTGSFLNLPVPAATVANPKPDALDQFTGDDYGDAVTYQKTVWGTGNQQEINFGSTSIAFNDKFLKSGIVDFSMFFNNISINLPYGQVNPSDCFSPTKAAATDADITAGAAAATGLSSSCDVAHVDGLMSANAVPATGYLPVIGAINGAFGGSPDFMAQTDYNSSVTGTAPEPGTLALLGLAFAGLGLTTARRRRS